MFRLFFVFLMLNLPTFSFADSKKALECYYKQDNACLESELWRLAETNDEASSQDFLGPTRAGDFYIGGGIGVSYLDEAYENTSAYDLNQIRGGRVLDTRHSRFDANDDYGLSYFGFVGMPVTEYVSLEISALELGGAEFSEHSDLYFTDGSSVSTLDSLILDMRGLSLSGLFFQRFHERSAVYMRLGGVWSEQTRRYSNDPLNLEIVNNVVRIDRARRPGEEYSENDFGLILGLGTSYDLSGRYSLRAEIARTDLPRGYLLQASTSVVYRL